MNTLRLLGFVSPQLALAVLGLPVVLFLQPYFAASPGLSLAAVGVVFVITRIFDVVTDPTLGWVADSVRTPFGRRKFWMAISIPIMIAGVYGLFIAPPPADPLVLSAWLALLYTGWTFIHMSHLSWASEFAGDYDRRTVVQGFITATYILGILIALIIAVVAAQGQTDPYQALAAQVRAIGLVTLALLPISCLLCFVSAPEPPIPAPAKIALGEALVSLARNGPLGRVVAADFLSGLAAGVTGASLVFVGVQFLVLSPAEAPVLILVSFVSGLVCVPFWAWLATRLGKHNAIIVGAAYQILTAPLILFLPKGDMGLAVAAWAVSGANFSASIFLARAMLGDVVDLVRARTGVERSGMFFGLLSASNKMGYAAAGLAYVALEIAGYDPTAQVQSDQALTWLVGLFVGAPVVCAAFTIVLMLNFPITREEQKRLREEGQTVQPPSTTIA